MVVPQQLALAAELQLTHAAGEELDPDVGEGVGHAGRAVRERGAAHPAQPQLRQVALAVLPDGERVRGEGSQAGFTRRLPAHLQDSRGRYSLRLSTALHLRNSL